MKRLVFVSIINSGDCNMVCYLLNKYFKEPSFLGKGNLESFMGCFMKTVLAKHLKAFILNTKQLLFLLKCYNQFIH